MAKIFFSLSGEGLGHAIRVRSLVEELRAKGHEMVLFAPESAYSLLSTTYLDGEVRVREIPGLRYAYSRDDKVNYRGTIGNFLRYASRLSRLVRELEAVMEEEEPDLVITDFEPALPRAARRCGIPFVSVNHQHFLVVNDLSRLPNRLRRHAHYMSWVVRRYYQGQARTVVSQFYFPPVKPRYRDEVTQVGVLLRPQFFGARRSNEGYLVAYLRRAVAKGVVDALKACGREVRLYGLGGAEPDGNVEYRTIADERFVEDLAACSGVVTTAGNQLVGEAMYLGKPVLAMPEPNNMEQYINAFYLEDCGGGEWREMSEVSGETIRSFFGDWEDFNPRFGPEELNGNRDALSAIDQVLSEA